MSAPPPVLPPPAPPVAPAPAPARAPAPACPPTQVPTQRTPPSVAWLHGRGQRERWVMGLALLITLLLHLGLGWWLPRLQWSGSDSSAGSLGSVAPDNTPFEVELLPNLTPPAPVPPPPAPNQFVEANPDAPDNTPDKTNFFAAQNQQAAQPKPVPDSTSPIPASEGDRKSDTTALVTGQLAPLAPPAPPPAPETPETPPTPEKPPPEEAARLEQVPLPGTVAITGDDPAGFGSKVAPTAPRAADVPVRVEGQAEGVKEATATEGAATGLYFKVDPQRPQARPKLAPNVVRARPTPLRQYDISTSNLGLAAYDAKWSSYGEYLRRFIETVQIEWERIIEVSRTYPTRGTRVTVTFRMIADGTISEIVKVSSNGTRSAESGCTSAIVARGMTAPGYGPWTEEMIALLGRSQEMTVTFLYE